MEGIKEKKKGKYKQKQKAKKVLRIYYEDEINQGADVFKRLFRYSCEYVKNPKQAVLASLLYNAPRWW